MCERREGRVPKGTKRDEIAAIKVVDGTGVFALHKGRQLGAQNNPAHKEAAAIAERSLGSSKPVSFG